MNNEKKINNSDIYDNSIICDGKQNHTTLFEETSACIFTDNKHSSDKHSTAYKQPVGNNIIATGKISAPTTLDQLYTNRIFLDYYNHLIDYNSRFNLTSITAKEDIYLKHFYDSILPAALLPIDATVLDVGSGAGFPGICLKLVRPDIKLTMLDSVSKKVGFLSDMIAALDLSNTTAVHSRIEDFAFRNFDVVTSRAVAATNILAEYCLPFVKQGGFALLYKSATVEDEVDLAKAAIKKLGGVLEQIYKINLTDEIVRSFVVLRKVNESPSIYPRKGNKPRLNPLGT